jgi:hypothetical protein
MGFQLAEAKFSSDPAKIQHRLSRRQTTGGDESRAEPRKESIVFPSVNSTNGSKIYPEFSS